MDMVTTKTWTHHCQFVSNGNGVSSGHCRSINPLGWPVGEPANRQTTGAIGDTNNEGSGWSAEVSNRFGLFFWGSVWTTAAWCELRRDFARLGDAAFDARPARAIDLFQDSNLRNVSATTPASAQFCTEQLL